MLKSKPILTLITLIIAGETIFFLPFVLARIFRPTLLLAFNITNTELGTYFSVYGIVAMVSYFFGGPLADRFPARNLLSIALWLTGLGGFVMSFMPIKWIMMVLYGFWGLTTIFLFWAALIRATREWGGTDFQGRAFGWLEGGRGATAALLGTLALLIFSDFSPESEHLASISAERISSFKVIILSISAFTLFAGILVWLFVPANKEYRPVDGFKISQIGKLMKRPSVWLLAVIIVCGYVGYKITDDYSLYANQVLGFDEFKSAGVGTATLWIRAFSAIMAGYFADKIRSSKIICLCFALTLIGGVLTALGILEQRVTLTFTILTVSVIGVYGVRALYFALIHEGGISIYYTGTAVGIISVLGFTPDVFMSPWMGYLLDKSPGPEGHRHVFIVLSSFAVLGFIAGYIFILLNKKQKYSN